MPVNTRTQSGDGVGNSLRKYSLSTLGRKVSAASHVRTNDANNSTTASGKSQVAIVVDSRKLPNLRNKPPATVQLAATHALRKRKSNRSSAITTKLVAAVKKPPPNTKPKTLTTQRKSSRKITSSTTFLVNRLKKKTVADATSKGKRGKTAITSKKGSTRVGARSVSVAPTPQHATKRKLSQRDQSLPPPGLPQKKARKSKKGFALSPKPFVKEYLVDPTFEQNLPIPFISPSAHSKLLIRAVLLNDMKQLKKLTQDKKHIASYVIPRSFRTPRDAFSYAIETENFAAMKILIPVTVPDDLTPVQKWLIEEESTGRGNKMMFGHALRSVTVGRGGKEGNAALTKDQNVFTYTTAWGAVQAQHIHEALEYGLPLSSLDKIKSIRASDDYDHFSIILYSAIYLAVQSGHNEIASKLIESAITKGGFGFNTLHQEALVKSKKSPLSPFKTQSVGKKTIGNFRITPLHCAAINPDPYCLITLLRSQPLFTVTDMLNWTLVHYAAACTGTGPLEHLISLGISTNQVNKTGDTPAHVAAQNGRWKNLEHILKAESKVEVEPEDGVKHKVPLDAFSVTRSNKSGLMPFHAACFHGHLDAVKTLAGSPLVDINKPIPAQFDKLTPLMIAACHGHLEILKYLVGLGAKLQLRDRRGNTALTHAVINGHAHIVSYLLRLGDNHLVKDSSGNTLIHYASAYGWYYNLMLLMDAGCCPSEPNQWKLTPLAISFMKGHIGIVEILLKQPGVNVNAPIDAQGLTLLLQTCSNTPSKDVISRLKYLTEELKVDCEIGDYEQNSAVHYLVKSDDKVLKAISKQKKRGWGIAPERDEKSTLEILNILIKSGASFEAKNSSQDTPISEAINLGCFQLAQAMIGLGATLSSEPNAAGDTILHLLVDQLAETDSTVSEFYKNSAKNPESLASMKTMARTYNNLGMTPLLLTLKQYKTVEDVDSGKRIIEFILFLVLKLNSDVNAVIKDVGKACSRNSVLHLAACVNYADDLLSILVAKNPNLDPVNADFRTPLTMSIIQRNQSATKILIENGANLNFVSLKDEKNMILLEASQTPNSFSLIPLFVSKGADVKENVDVGTRNSVLHFVSKNPSASCAVESIKTLLKAGVPVNSQNKYGRTSLHLAVNSRGGETDISYDVEDVLIEAGASLNIRDVKGRIPLHFAFLKIGKGKTSKGEPNSFMDPIELVTLLTSGMKETRCSSDIEAVDEIGQTPCHIAAIRGATISASHILSESSNPIELLNLSDKNGNSPFALAVLNDHEGCALMLLQAGANFVMDLNREYTKALKDEIFSGSWVWQLVKYEAERLDKESAKQSKYSILQEIVRKDWQGLLYLMLEKLKSAGSGVTPAIEAALKTNRLKLAAKLIDRVKTYEQLITKKQSLLHTFAQYTSPAETENSQLQSRIVEILVSKKSDVNSIDCHQSTPLIYAAMKWNAHLCTELTKLMNIRQIPHLKPDFVGRTPFSVLFWDPIAPDVEFPTNLKTWAETVLFSGGDGNTLCQYPIQTSNVPGVRYVHSSSGDPNYFMASISTYFSPLIITVIYGAKKVVKWLLSLEGKINVNFPDSEGRTALMHAVRLNDIQMVKLLLNSTSYDFENDKTPWTEPSNQETSKKTKTTNTRVTTGINLNAVDKQGWTVIHHLVQPLGPDTSLVYARSTQILKLLVSAGTKLDTRSHGPLGETSLEMAIRLREFSLAKCLARLIGTAAVVGKTLKEVSEYEPQVKILNSMNSIPIAEFQKDSKQMLDLLKSKFQLDNNEAEVAEPDSLTDLTMENSMVLMDDERQVPFDCLLTQVDLSYGMFGLYNFYKMQLIKQTKGPELIILFTRWGRMGDTGQFQKTPLPTEVEAIAEFKKIFRSKTGNVWDELSQTDFVNIPKKYNLVNLDRRQLSKLDPKYSENVKINFNEMEKSSQVNDSCLSNDILDVMKKLALEHKSSPLKTYENTETMLPFGQLEYTALLRAEKILDEINKLLTENKTQRDKADKWVNMGDSVLKLSEEYFTLIPVHGYALEKIKPFTDFGDLRKHQQIVRDILHNEFAFQLLLAAQWNQEKMNPFDYIYRALGTKLQTLDQSSQECQLILQYIYNTSSSSSQPIVEKIYRVEIPGAETQLIETGVGNRTLLWHGTSTCNLLSILHHGLQIAPLGYTYNGSLFGKGIYFADMFSKSVKYSNTVKPRQSSFVLLCEVALGGVQSVDCGWGGRDNEVLKPDKNSLKTSNSRWVPKPTGEVYWKGRLLSMGKKCENVLPEQKNFGLEYNEYIIFTPEQVNIRYLIQFRGDYVGVKMKNLL